MRLEFESFESNVASLPLTHNQTDDITVETQQPDVDRLLKQGISAAQSGERALARTLLFKVTEADPQRADAWLWLASISEYPEELLGFLNNVLAIDPENDRARQWETATRSLLAKTFVQRGITANDEGQPDLAAQCFDKAIGQDKKCETAWFWKASMTNVEAERVEYLEKVLSINANNDDARAALAAIADGHNTAKFADSQKAAVAGDWKTAEDLIDQLLESDLSHLDAWMLRSHISLSLDEKLLAYDRILEIDPENTYARSGHDFLAKTIEAVRPQSVEDIAIPQPSEQDFFGVENESETPKNLMPSAAGMSALPDPTGPSAAADEPYDFEESRYSMSSDVDKDAHQVSDFSPTAMIDAAPAWHSNAFANAENESDYEPHAFAGTYQNNDTPVPAAMEDAHHAGEHLAFEELHAEPEGHHDDAPMPELDAAENSHEYPSDDADSEPSQQPVESDEHEFTKVAEDEMHSAETAHDAPTEIDFAYTPEDDFHHTDDHSIHETVPANYDYAEPVPNDEMNAALASFGPFESKVESSTAVVEQNHDQAEVEHESVASGHVCPYCASDNDPLAFSCSSCHAMLSMSDIESLLGDTHANREVIQDSITQMEAEWNLREFNESELTTLGIGHFNLKNYERGFAYIQEASRLNPNNVILADQMNSLAIRLEEMRRQTENREAMPRGKTILVVDDSATVRKLISSKLEKCGHNVLCAVDGVEAMETIETVVPDLVLLDISMPRMDGYSVCKLIRANDAVKDVPVVMISGKDGFFDKVRGRMAGTTGYITKPFGPETLMRALETYLLPEEASAE